MKNFFSTLWFILSILLTMTLIRCCNNAEKPNSSFVKEVAKESRKMYDDFREGFGLDTTKKDTTINTPNTDKYGY